MNTNDRNVKPEQRRPKDVATPASEDKAADQQSRAPPTVQPAGEKDESERPVVNPVSGVPF
jgi:hypothetical protein